MDCGGGDRAPKNIYRCAMITGASSGIGEALAREMPAETDLVLVARSREKLEALAGSLRRPGRMVDVLVADLATAEGRETAIERAEAQSIDLLVNNAGTGPFGAVLDHSAEQERATVELNVVATSVLTRALLPGMIERARAERRRAGLIILSSPFALVPAPFFTTYVATKAFALYYAEGLAEELRREPVDVLGLLPGPTRTEFGSRAGFSAGNVPWAAEPSSVARSALGALGRRTLLATSRLGPMTLDPVLLPRRALAAGMGRIMELAARRYGTRQPG